MAHASGDASVARSTTHPDGHRGTRCPIRNAPSLAGKLTASAAAPLPTGTTLLITGTGVASIGTFSVSGGATASQAVLNGTTRLFTLTSELAAGTSVSFRTTLSTSARFTLNGATTPPDGDVGPATVTSSLTGCSVS